MFSTPHLASPLPSSDQEALLGTFPKANDTVDGGPLDLLTETHEEVSQQSCKQPQDGLPEKQVTNSRLYLFIYTYLSTFSVPFNYCRAIHKVFVPFKGIKISVELKVLESLAYSSAESAVLLNLLGNIKKLQTDIGSSAEGLLL